jgi:hypothetical protein
VNHRKRIREFLALSFWIAAAGVMAVCVQLYLAYCGIAHFARRKRRRLGRWYLALIYELIHEMHAPYAYYSENDRRTRLRFDPETGLCDGPLGYRGQPYPLDGGEA